MMPVFSLSKMSSLTDLLSYAGLFMPQKLVKTLFLKKWLITGQRIVCEIIKFFFFLTIKHFELMNEPAA